jgi:haloacetate dehalogenase
MVIAPVVRGFGLSDEPVGGFDVGTVSGDIRQLVGQRGHKNVCHVGHDLSVGVYYAWAAVYSDEVRRLVLD